MEKEPCQGVTFLKIVNHSICFTGRGEEIDGQVEIWTNGGKYKIIEIMEVKGPRDMGGKVAQDPRLSLESGLQNGREPASSQTGPPGTRSE